MHITLGTTPLMRRRAVKASAYPSSPPTPAGTYAPAESFMPKTGMPRSAAMVNSRASFRPLVASIEPARTVKSCP
jgi:hypothetical protein